MPDLDLLTEIRDAVAATVFARNRRGKKDTMGQLISVLITWAFIFKPRLAISIAAGAILYHSRYDRELARAAIDDAADRYDRARAASNGGSNGAS